MMNKNKNEHVPVYFFIGFKLLEANLKRTSDGELKSFGVKILESLFNEKNSTHVLTIQFNMKFENGEESTFLFNAGYQVNDINWYKQLEKRQINALFFSVMFPYVRQKIHSLTDDSRGNVNIPTIDLRQADLTKGATFEKNTNH